MQAYKKESLEILRQRIDLVEVLSSHLQLHKSGSSYKGLCPFHEEKTPSFMVQKGDTHYHCFGCGAHGDAIAFMMGYLKMSFVDAVESLAERFQVALEKTEEVEEKGGLSKASLKQALEKACRFYHFMLLYSDEGHAALQYLYQRGIDLDFIRTFQVGFAPRHPDLFQKLMHQLDVDEAVLEQAGLVSTAQSGKKRDFFSDRITFPIRDAVGAVIGFSARKFKEETFGGKYINTSETPLFKKSQVLFGLSYCRQRIAKERKAIVVEGQIDALRLIHAGFNIAVAGQGTAFGEGHVRELLHLGVNHIYLALDGDDAGREASVKIGNLFQKKGVEVSVLLLPEKSDPDTLLREQGPPGFQKYIDESADYLHFFIQMLSKQLDIHSPSGKSELVETVAAKVRQWEHPVMVHESLKKLAEILQVPETAVGVGSRPEIIPAKKPVHSLFSIDPDRILETDLLRWLFLMGETHPRLIEIARLNLAPHHFRTEICRRIFEFYIECYLHQKPRDLFALAIDLEKGEDQALLSEIMQKKINLLKAEEGIVETTRKILQRKWMEDREAVKLKIQSGKCSEEEVLELAKQFDEIRKKPPEVILP